MPDGNGNQEIVEPDELAKIRELSIQRRAESTPGAWGATFWFGVPAEGEISAWWSPQRDEDLRVFWMKEGNDILSGAVSSIVKKFKAMSWSLEGPEHVVEAYQDILSNADYGEGWSFFLAKVVTDYLTQDKGAFIELIGEGPADGPIGPAGVLGLAHLDAGQCQLTGDPVYPVLYNNPKDGKPHKLHATRVVHLVDMPSPNESMNGVGFCSVSRVVASSQVLLKLAQYKNEKLSDLPEAGLLLLNNVLPKQWEDAKGRYQAERRRLGHELWANIMTFIGLDPAQPTTAQLLSFANLPEGFDERSATEIYVNVVALAFGVDVREFWPMSAGPLGTGKETEIQHQKAKGKGIGDLLSIVERAINWKVLPETVTFGFDFQDLEEDEQAADVNQTVVTTIMKMWVPPSQPGEMPLVTRDEIRQMLAENTDYFKRDFLAEPVTEDLEVTDTEREVKALYGRWCRIGRDGKKQYALKFSASQPRDAQGRWTSDYSLASSLTTEQISGYMKGPFQKESGARRRAEIYLRNQGYSSQRANSTIGQGVTTIHNAPQRTWEELSDDARQRIGDMLGHASPKFEFEREGKPKRIQAELLHTGLIFADSDGHTIWTEPSYMARAWIRRKGLEGTSPGSVKSALDTALANYRAGTVQAEDLAEFALLELAEERAEDGKD